MSAATERNGRAAILGLAMALGLGCVWADAQDKAPDAANARPSPCGLTASADKNEVALGEPFAVEMKGTGPDGTMWTFPRELASEAVELRVAEVAPGTMPAGTFRYSAVAFAVGTVEVPAIEAKCHLADGSEHVARSAPVAVRMVSVLPKDPQQQKLADVRPPVGLAIGRAFWIALCVALAVLGGVAYAVLRRMRRRTQPHRAASETAPDAEARAALARLGQEDWLARGQYRPFYIALAQIAKRYLERRLSAPILEMTSAETITFLRQGGTWADCVGVMRELTAVADRVKFAEACGHPEEATRHLRATSDLVDALDAALRSAAEATSGRAA